VRAASVSKVYAPSERLCGLSDARETVVKLVGHVFELQAEVKKKIKQAYCPPQEVAGNPCIEYVQYIVLPWFNEFEVQRDEKNGGSKTYKDIAELKKDYTEGLLHPGDLKPALSAGLNKILQVCW
jgi:tyrosyl-tRNA synthetase